MANLELKSRASLHRALGSILLACLANACSVVNQLDACDAPTQEFRVNQRVDAEEIPDGPKAALPISNNQMLVGYTATDGQLSDPGSTSEVRVVLLSLTDGARATLCDDTNGDLEKVLSPAGFYAYGVSVVHADIAPSEAAVGWTQVAADGTRGVKVVFLDSGGCPLLPGPITPGIGVTHTDGLAIAWSNARHAVLATYEDERNVYASWLSGFNTTSAQILEAGTIVGHTASAMTSDGHALVAWTANDVTEAATLHGELHAILLDPDGTTHAAPTGSGKRAAFSLDLPGGGLSTDVPRIALAATAGRFAVAVALAPTPADRSAVFVRQFDTNGVALGPWVKTEAEGSEAQFFPSVSFAPRSSVLVGWQSTTRGGSVAELFDSALTPRFNSVSCDEGAFDVGTRTREAPNGYASLVCPDSTATGGDIAIVHPGEPAYDSHNEGVLAWTMPFSKLWPAAN